MRLLLLAWGSRGDVQPFVALGRGLTAAGHDVDVAAADDFGPMIGAAGLGFRSFGIDIDAAIMGPAGSAWLGGHPTPFAEARAMTRVMTEFAPTLVGGVRDLVDGYDGYVSGTITADLVAALTRVRGGRHVMGLLQPALPAADPRSSVFSLVSRPSVANRLWGRLASQVVLDISRPVIDSLRSELGLGRRRLTDFLAELETTAVLVAASPEVVPPDRTWPPDVQVTGWWVDPVPDPLPRRVTDFLDDGPPPVYVGFGSMPSVDVDRQRGTVLTALRRAGVRGIIGGRAGATADDLGRDDLGPDVIGTGEVAHEALFGRVAGIVHHGGAGTTGAALRSGRPSAVVPHVGDQRYWGRRTHELGVGPPPLPVLRADVDALTGLLTVLRDDDRARARAAVVGRRLRAEHGVSRAVAAIERALAG